MMNTPLLADFMNDNQIATAAVARACVNLVDAQAGELGVSAMYAGLVGAARDVGAVDRMLYQLAGDPAYAEQGALLVLGAAWNYSDAVAPIQRLLLNAAQATGEVDGDRLATSVLYGMYLLAREGRVLDHVTYRTPDGAVVTQPAGDGMTAAALFDAVRDLY
jgi:hypothetical protein